MADSEMIMANDPQRVCHAPKCREPVALKTFMCPRHWEMVPEHLQQAINKVYDPTIMAVPGSPYSEIIGAAQGAVWEKDRGRMLQGLRKATDD